MVIVMPKGWIETNFIDMNDTEKCIFYLKCRLTKGKNIGCNEAIENFHSFCGNRTINCPSGSFFRPYAHMIYRLNALDLNPVPNDALFNGCIKCDGYQVHTLQDETFISWYWFKDDYFFDMNFCRDRRRQNVNNFPLNTHFLNDTKYSFFCTRAYRHISKYCVGNRIRDCAHEEDEDGGPGCQIKQKHRLSCSAKKPICLQVPDIGDSSPTCKNAIDEYLPQLNWRINHHKCVPSNKPDCQVLRTYIQSPSSVSTVANAKVPLFRQYCDTIWHIPNGFDESLCSVWKCSYDEYQYLSNHCIPLQYVLNQDIRDWNCPDASDRIGLFRIKQLSKHNARLINQSKLQDIKETLILFEKLILLSALSRLFCNRTEEYGCILANVMEPLNFIKNRPWINLIQIGDGIIDCYGGLDERNLLTCGNNTFLQRGFDFHCNNQECIPFDHHCQQRCSNDEDSLLCDQLPKKEEFITKIHICKTVNPCRHNSICYPIMNKINDTSAYYCYCNSNSYGKQCEHLLPVSSSLNYSKNALQYTISSSKSIYLCPNHLYEPTCHIKHTCLQKNSCNIHRGICYTNPDNMTYDYICICDKKFFGDHCEFNSASVKIYFTDLSFVQSPSNYIMSLIIQLCTFDNKTLDLIVRQKRVYQGIPSTMIEIFHNDFYLPRIDIMKLYHKQDLSNDYIANLNQPKYFLLYIISTNVSQMNLTSPINMTNYCPYILRLYFRKIFRIFYTYLNVSFI